MIYIVRHGETDWNIAKRCQGHNDIPLNQNGISQAYLLKEKFGDIVFDMVFSSPLKRAVETARILGGDNIIIDNRLIERNNGLLEGKIRDEIVEIKNQPGFREIDYGIETVDMLQERASSFLRNILDNNSGMNILIVSHAGIIKNMICCLENNDGYILGNCEVYMYRN